MNIVQTVAVIPLVITVVNEKKNSLLIVELDDKIIVVAPYLSTPCKM